MFLGTFTQKILAKGQIVLPAKIRAQLPDRKAVLVKGFDKCVYGFSVGAWEEIARQELLRPILSDDGRKMRQQVFAQAEEVDADQQGRVVLPAYLREYAGIATEMVIIGAGDHFEIWAVNEWAIRKEEIKDIKWGT